MGYPLILSLVSIITSVPDTVAVYALSPLWSDATPTIAPSSLQCTCILTIYSLSYEYTEKGVANLCSIVAICSSSLLFDNDIILIVPLLYPHNIRDCPPIKQRDVGVSLILLNWYTYMYMYKCICVYKLQNRENILYGYVHVHVFTMYMYIHTKSRWAKFLHVHMYMYIVLTDRQTDMCIYTCTVKPLSMALTLSFAS